MAGFPWPPRPRQPPHLVHYVPILRVHLGHSSQVPDGTEQLVHLGRECSRVERCLPAAAQETPAVPPQGTHLAVGALTPVLVRHEDQEGVHAWKTEEGPGARPSLRGTPGGPPVLPHFQGSQGGHPPHLHSLTSQQSGWVGPAPPLPAPNCSPAVNTGENPHKRLRNANPSLTSSNCHESHYETQVWFQLQDF